MVVLTWIYGQNKLVKFAFPLRWNDLKPGQRPSDMRQGSSKPIQQCELKTIGCYFLCSGHHNTSLSIAVKKIDVRKYHSHDVVACEENGYVSSHFQAMRSDGSTMLPCGLGSF